MARARRGCQNFETPNVKTSRLARKRFKGKIRRITLATVQSQEPEASPSPPIISASGQMASTDPRATQTGNGYSLHLGRNPLVDMADL